MLCLLQREIALHPSRMHLGQREDAGADEPDGDQQPGHNAPPVTAHEFGDSIPHGVGARSDRLVREIAPQVLGELCHRGVAFGRRAPQCLGEDVVEISLKSPAPRFARHRRCARWLFRDDRVDQLGVRLGLGVERMLTCQYHVKHDTKGVHVRGSRYGLAQQLLGCCVLRRECPRVRLSWCGRRILAEKLRDAEVEELHSALARHQDVGRLQVPMNDEMSVGVADRSQHALEHCHSSLDPEPQAIAVLIDRLAIDELEHEVRL